MVSTQTTEISSVEWLTVNLLLWKSAVAMHFLLWKDNIIIKNNEPTIFRHVHVPVV